MNLKEIKEKFCNFINDFDQQDYTLLMEFIKFLVAEFEDNPNRIFEFLKSKKNSSNFFESNDDPSKLNDILLCQDPMIKQEIIEKNDNNETTVHSKVRKTDLCKVCEASKVSTYFHGPGVCNNCRNFFVRAYPAREDLKCNSNEYCFTIGKSFLCRKCRFSKCIKIGMKLRYGVKRKCSAYNRWPKIELGSKCICCEVANSTVGYHYGSAMCLKCAKWYSACRYSQEKVKRFKCFSLDRLFENRCFEIPDFDIGKCSKCRYEKILKNIKIK